MCPFTWFKIIYHTLNDHVPPESHILSTWTHPSTSQSRMERNVCMRASEVFLPFSTPRNFRSQSPGMALSWVFTYKLIMPNIPSHRLTSIRNAWLRLFLDKSQWWPVDKASSFTISKDPHFIVPKPRQIHLPWNFSNSSKLCPNRMGFFDLSPPSPHLLF